MGLWGRNATQSERGAGQIASRDARHAHFGRIEARKPRWCRPGFADRARTRTQGNRRVYLLDRVGGAKEDRALGVGKDNYNWYLQKVHLVPYDWDQQVTLLRRELERARAALALE